MKNFLRAKTGAAGEVLWRLREKRAVRRMRGEGCAKRERVVGRGADWGRQGERTQGDYCVLKELLARCKTSIFIGKA